MRELLYADDSALVAHSAEEIQRIVDAYQPARALGSANCNSLEMKRTRIKAGDGSFVVAAASLWNTLPNFIKICHTLASFKCRLKTYLSHRK